MSEFAEKIKRLRGRLTQKEFAARCDLSLRTISGIESEGDSVHLKTLRQIKQRCKLSEADWLDLLISWLKLELDADFRSLRVETAPDPKGPWILKERNDADVLRLFQLLSEQDQIQVIKAMQRKEVLACLPAINQVWDKLDEQHLNRLIKDDQPVKLS